MSTFYFIATLAFGATCFGLGYLVEKKNMDAEAEDRRKLLSDALDFACGKLNEEIGCKPAFCAEESCQIFRAKQSARRGS